MLDDDEPTDLLADEDRVRDALLAAVDVQRVPPVHTDLKEIVRRGRRRARLQVVSASVAAVVLIGAVALGATVLGRLGDQDRTSAAGPGSSLPMTSQTITTSPNTPPPSASQDFYEPDAACIFPAMQAPTKWMPLSPGEINTFRARTAAFQQGSMKEVTPAVSGELDERGAAATRSVQIIWHGQVTLVTLSSSFYGGTPTMAASEDQKTQQMPPDCAGAASEHQLSKTMLAVEYPAAPVDPTAPVYLRVQLYTESGIRYDVTEAVNAVNYISSSPSNTVDGSGKPAVPITSAGFSWPTALSMAQLVAIAMDVASVR